MLVFVRPYRSVCPSARDFASVCLSTSDCLLICMSFLVQAVGLTVLSVHYVCLVCIYFRLSVYVFTSVCLTVFALYLTVYLSTSVHLSVSLSTGYIFLFVRCALCLCIFLSLCMSSFPSIRVALSLSVVNASV